MPDRFIEARPLLVHSRIVSVSERHFVMVDETQTSRSMVLAGGQMFKSFCGMSGSPVYAIPNDPASGDSWLAGFVYEEGPGHALMVAHADHIHADGTIR